MVTTIMKEKVNLRAIIVALIAVIIGIVIVFLLRFNAAWVGIGGSLIASGLVILLQTLFVDRIKINEIDKWGLERIYYTRSEQNTDTDPQLKKAKYQIDAVVFGLKSFRDKHGHLIEMCLNRGVNIRILTMDPEGEFIAQREREEKVSEGSIKQTIEQLVAWANQLNTQHRKGRIEIKGYNCMTLDFYWRVDDTVCIGPYWYGTNSQQTITFRFNDDHGRGLGFKQYVEHFEKLWNEPSLSRTLTKPFELQSRRKRG